MLFSNEMEATKVSYFCSSTTQVHEHSRGLVDFCSIIHSTASEDDCHTLRHGFCKTPQLINI